MTDIKRKISEEDFNSIFIEFENKNNLFNSKISGVHFWHLIRFSIYDKIQSSIFSTGESHSNITNISVLKKIYYKIKQIRFMLFNNPLLYFKQKDILVLNHNRRIKDDDVYTCIYTDLLIENLSYSSVYFEEPYLEKHFRPVKNNNIVYTDYIDLVVAIKKRIGFFFISIEEKELIRYLFEKINTTFASNLNFKMFKKFILNSILEFKFKKKYYLKFLKRVKPKIIIEVVSYGMSRYIFNYLGKELTIPTIELQHGVIGKHHIAYNFNRKAILKTFPEYILLFGNFWKNNTGFPIDIENIIIAGWPYLEKKVNNSFKSIKNEKFSKNILFISQGSIGKELSKVAVELSRSINSSYRIIYKLHPGEYSRWRIDYPWLNNTNITVIDDNKHDIHHYFKLSSYQIGVYSTALFEGISYGLETYILKFFGYKYTEELVSNNLAILVTNSNDLKKLIESNIKSNSELRDIEYLWESNSLDKMKKHIDNIIKGAHK